MANQWSDLDITNPTYWPLVGTSINTTGGGGSGAVIFAIVAGGVITSLNIINGAPTSGSYTSNFSATITGSGTGASVTLTVSAGNITGYTSLVGGTGYKGTAPALQLNSSTNFVSALVASLASWRAPVNGNQQALSNLGQLTMANGAGIITPGYIQLGAQDLPGTLYTISAASWAGGVATITVTAGHNIAVGQLVTVQSVNPAGYNTSFAKTLSGTTGTTIKVAVAVNPGTYVSGGQIVVDGVAAAAGMIAANSSGQFLNYTGGAWATILTNPSGPFQIDSATLDSQFYISHAAPRLSLGNNATYSSRTQAVRLVMATTNGDFGLPNAGDSWLFTEGVGAGTAGDLRLGTLGFRDALIVKASNGYTGIGISPSHYLHVGVDDAAKPSTNTWTIASDRRLKDNVADFTDGLATICSIRPVTYSYNGLAGTPKGVQGIGVIAQEAEVAVPYCVSRSHTKMNPSDKQDTEILSFNSHALTYLTVNAFKEINARLKALEAKL